MAIADSAHAASHEHGVGRHRHDLRDPSVLLVAEADADTTRSAAQSTSPDLPWATPPQLAVSLEMRPWTLPGAFDTRPLTRPDTPPLRPPRA
jgi:hypothetical protein